MSIVKIIPEPFKKYLRDFKNFYLDGFSNKSYSQEAEDLILKRIFERQDSVFYCDVGAHHPFRFSNTYIFYKKGHFGINIDANPNGIALFKRWRPRDINLQYGISDKKQELTYFMFNEPAVNTFDEKLAKDIELKGIYKKIKEKSMITITLTELLDKYLPNGEHVDFLTIDTEGTDFNVLTSLDLAKYNISVILIEILSTTLQDLIGSSPSMDIY